jgi:hypothetical protein
MNELASLASGITFTDFKAQEFEKDDPTNFHVEFVHASA